MLNRGMWTCPTQKVVSIKRVIRTMCGQSQSRLVQCDDGSFSVVKCLGNPQGHRSLINSLVCSRLIQLLGVATPNCYLHHLPDYVQLRDQISFQEGDCQSFPEGNLHFGSQLPVDPGKTAIFDFMPRSLLTMVCNLQDFAKMFVIDTWVSKTNARQAIFFRNQETGKMQASFIGHGMCLGGASWRLGHSPDCGLAMPSFAYGLIDMDKLTKTYVSQVQSVKGETFDSIIHSIPSNWLMPGDAKDLEILFMQLRFRQMGLAELVKRKLNFLSGIKSPARKHE